VGKMHRTNSVPASRRCLPLAGGLFVLVMLAGTGAAHAQQWLIDRQYEEGKGIKLGSQLVLHPGLGIEGGYDSNVYLSDASPVWAIRLRISPHLDLATVPPQRAKGSDGLESGKKPLVAFRLGLAGVYEDWFGTDKSLGKRRDFGVMADMALTLFPYGKWRLTLEDQFTRTITPPNESTPKNYTRDYNVAGLGLKYVPGDALSVGLKYAFGFNYYEAKNLQSAGNYQAHMVSLTTQWKFLPKTSLTFDGDFNPYIRESSRVSGTNIYVAKKSFTTNLWVGVVGLFTKRFGMALRAGYGGGFYDNGDDLDTGIGQAELRFFVTPAAAIRLGFIRDQKLAYFTNYFMNNQAYLTYEHLFIGRVLLAVKLSGAYLQYSRMYVQAAGGALSPATALMTPNSKRTDWAVGGTVFTEYRIKDWIAINLTLQYEADFTEYKLVTTASGNIPESYQKFAGFLGVRAMY